MTKISSSFSASAISADRIVLRTSWLRIMALSLIGPVSACCGLLLPFATDTRAGRPGISTGLMASFLAYLALVSAGSAWLQRRNRLVLGGDGEITVQSGLRAHTLSAADIQAVTLERNLGSRTVKLWLADGSYRRAGVAGRTEGLFQQHFDRDYHLIGDWWLANRGAQWQPNYTARQAPVPMDFNWNPNG